MSMETVKSRSESPYSRSKSKSNSTGTSENGNSIIEQIKTKKKNSRNKNKSQTNGKENEDLTNNGKNFSEEEKDIPIIVSCNAESNNDECENGINNGIDAENRTENEIQEMEDKENEPIISGSETAEEKVFYDSSSNITESRTVEECKSVEDVTIVDVEEDCTQQDKNMVMTGAESNPKTESSASFDPLPEPEIACENSEEKAKEDTLDVLNGETNSSVPEQDAVMHSSEIHESSQVSVNGSDGSSHYEDTSLTKDDIQVSPDTVSKDENSFSNKITSFFGKLSYSYEQKQDPEVSSSKKIEVTAVNHPYLSRVSGRRGIKDRLNSSATVFGSKEMEVKTPENSKISLDDSFRVRTNPPRLNTSELKENSTLRKFKGKRCLNAEDEPEEEEEEEMYLNTMKRRKLDEKTQESGLWGSILWSPFKKKSLEEEDQLKVSASESKLSRLLSPFWFWKKTAAGQKEK